MGMLGIKPGPAGTRITKRERYRCTMPTHPCNVTLLNHKHFLPRSSDFLYKLHMVPKQDKVILWKSMEDILSEAIATCLANIQANNQDDPNALLYFCINQSDLTGGIRSSVHSLHYSLAGMLKQFMLDFYRFVNSNANIKLDSTFEVYFHVCSGKDPTRPTNRRTAIPVRSLVGTRDLHSKILLPGTLINLPTGCPRNPHCFKDACMLVTVMFMIIKHLKPELYPKVRHITLVKSPHRLKNEAASILLSEINAFTTSNNLSSLGPHLLLPTIKLFAETYKVQIIVIVSLDGPKPETICSPSEFCDTLPRLYFLLRPEVNGTQHILAISNITTFFKTHRRAICFRCNNFYFLPRGKKLNSHKCRSAASCNKCFGFYASVEAFKDVTEPWQYCDRTTVALKTEQVCPKCGTTFDSQNCFNNHTLFCDSNLYYWQCPVCQKSVSMKKRSLEMVQASHQCDVTDKFCTTCCKVQPLSHICAVSKMEKTIFWPNVAVLSLTFQDAAGAHCQTCYNNHYKYIIENNVSYLELFKSKLYYALLCDAHKSKKVSEPNVIKLFYEADRFKFVGKTFSNNDFLASLTETNETINLTYSSTYVNKSNVSNKKRKIYSRPSLSCKNFHTASNQLLNFFLTAQLSNYTFIVYSNQEMLWLLDQFLSQFWQPVVIQSGRLVKKIYLSNLDLTFLLFENYCKGSLRDLISQFQLQRTVFCFPMAFNCAQFYGKTIPLPLFDSFLSFTDTAEDVNEKRIFYENLTSLFDINTNLYKTTTENLKTFLLSVTAFLRMSFEMQELLASVTGIRDQNPIHPFASNIMSLSSFSMAIFKYYFLNFFDVYSVDRPYTGFYSKVSGPEYEYLSFLNYSNPGEEIIHAFSRREGQMRIGHVIVDGYSKTSRTVYQFHGCLVSAKIIGVAEFN